MARVSQLANRHWVKQLVLVFGIALLLSLLLSAIRPARALLFDFGSAAIPEVINTQLYPPQIVAGRTLQVAKPELLLPVLTYDEPLLLSFVLQRPPEDGLQLQLDQIMLHDSPGIGSVRFYHLLIPASAGQMASRKLLLKTTAPAGRAPGTGLDWLAIDRAPPPLLEWRLFVRILLMAVCLWGSLTAATGWTRRLLIGIGLGLVPLLIVLRLWWPVSFGLVSAALLVLALAALLIHLVLRAGQGQPWRLAMPFQLPRPLLVVGELCLWVLVTIVMTYPLVFKLNKVIPNSLDNYITSWILAWDHHQLWRNPGQLFEANLLHPYPLALAHTEHMLGLYPLAAPWLLLGFSPQAVNNLTIIGSSVLSAYGMRLLCKELTGSTLASVAAAIIFTFHPYRLTEYTVIQIGIGVWIPFAFWALERFRRSGQWRYALFWGVMTLLQTLISYYQAVFLAVITLTYGLFFLFADPHFRDPRRLGKLVVMAVLIGLVHLPLLQPYLYLREDFGLERTLNEAGARPADFLVTAHKKAPYQTLSALLTAAAPEPTTIGIASWLTPESVIPPARRLFPELLPTMLSLIGLVAFRKRPLVWSLLLMFVVTVLFAFGAKLYLSTEPGSPPVMTMPLGYLGLQVLIRAPARFMIVGLLPMALLAGYGIMALQRYLNLHAPRAALPLCLVILALLGRELSDLPQVFMKVSQPPPSVQSWLAAQPSGAVLNLPRAKSRIYTEYRNEGAYNLLSTYGFHPTFNGISGFPMLPGLWDKDQRRDRFPNYQELDLLRGLGLRYLLVHQAFFAADDASEWPAARAALLKAPGLKQTLLLETTEIFEFDPDPWVDQIAAHLQPDQKLYISDGGELPQFFTALLAARLHRHVAAGETWVGMRRLTPTTNPLPDFALFSVAEDVSSAGYREADIVWRNALFKLIRRPGSSP